MLLFQK